MKSTIQIFYILYSFPVYAILVGYCFWRLVKRMENTSIDGVIGYSPEWEIIGYLIIGPIIAVIDIILTIYNKLKKWRIKS